MHDHGPINPANIHTKLSLLHESFVLVDTYYTNCHVMYIKCLPGLPPAPSSGSFDPDLDH